MHGLRVVTVDFKTALTMVAISVTSCTRFFIFSKLAWRVVSMQEKRWQEWEVRFMIRLFIWWTISLPYVDWEDSTLDEVAREHGVSPTHVDALWMVGYTGKWGEKEVSIWISSLTRAHSRFELESSWENVRSHDVLGCSSQHIEAWEWWFPETGGWWKQLIVQDVSLRWADWELLENGSSLFWCKHFWIR